MNRIAIDKTLHAILLALLLVAIKVPPVLAALANETLISHLPSGFKLGFNTEKGRMTMAEYVPEGETVEDWSRMITVQTFHGANHVDGDTFASGIAKQWKPACPGGDAQKIKGGVENGYPFALWMFTCPVNPQTNKPENMWLKMISGDDALYSVQYAYRRNLSKALITPAISYLRQAIVCDTRRSDRPCPAGL